MASRHEAQGQYYGEDRQPRGGRGDARPRLASSSGSALSRSQPMSEEKITGTKQTPGIANRSAAAISWSVTVCRPDPEACASAVNQVVCEKPMMKPIAQIVHIGRAARAARCGRLMPCS